MTDVFPVICVGSTRPGIPLPSCISRLPGHSSGELLFRRYAPFVPDAVGGYGAAFEGMMARVRARPAA